VRTQHETSIYPVNKLFVYIAYIYIYIYKHHSTFMPVLILKDVVNFYLSHGSNMHIAFIDISKAFDRVRYETLFIKLS